MRKLLVDFADLAEPLRTLGPRSFGMRPDNLLRSLAEVAKHGVAVDGPAITIRNREALVAFAQPNPLIDEREQCATT